jgi:carboxymethylenebutenolidase
MDAPVLTETVRIGAMGAYLARPDTADPVPGVLVGMELFGVSAHVRDVCERLAGLGFAALAPDLYHRTAPGVELPADAAGRERGFDLLHRMTRAEVVDDVRAAYDHLAARATGVAGMVGLSVGGHVAYLAAAELDLPAVAVVYGGWIPTTAIPLSHPAPTVDRTPDITGRMLLLVGEDDPIVPPAHRRLLVEALADAGVTHRLVTYPGVGHGFLCDRRTGYDGPAATDAWRRITALLRSAPL